MSTLDQSIGQPTDQRIDRILHELGATSAPSGLEQRLHARLAQRTALAAQRPFLFHRLTAAEFPMKMPQRAWFGAVTAGIVVIAAGCLMHFAHTQPEQIATAPPPTRLPSSGTAAKDAPERTRVAAFKSPVHEKPSALPSSPSAMNDSDAVALAETLAPSHPAPQLPLPEQTALSYVVPRGVAVEVAMFDPSHEPAARALAATRGRVSVREYLHGLLGPLATAQSLTSSSSLSSDDAVAVVDPEPPSSK